MKSAWRTIRLGDVTTVSSGYGFPKEEQGSSYGDFPFLKVSDMNLPGNETTILAANNYVDKSTVTRLKAKPFPAGAVIFPKIGAAIGTNKKRVLSRPSVVDNNVMGVWSHSEFLNSDYLYYFLLSFDLREISVPGALPSISASRANDILLPLPPLNEQRAMAEVLSAVQLAIHIRRRELELERERKAALMDYLFTHGTKGEPTKTTEIGKIPESWTTTALGNLICRGQGFIQSGPFGSQLHMSDYQNDGIPVVNPTHLRLNAIVSEGVPKVDKALADSLDKHYLEVGDVLISRRGDFSRYAYISDAYAHWLCGTGCLLIRVLNPLLDTAFLATWVSTVAAQSYLSANAVGTIMPNLNTKILESLPLPLPSPEEQKLIAKALGAVDHKIGTLQRELTLLSELFDSLLHELMSGRLSTLPLIEEGVIDG